MSCTVQRIHLTFRFIYFYILLLRIPSDYYGQVLFFPAQA